MARNTRPLTNNEILKAKPQEKDFTLHDGDGAGIKAITGGDAVAIDPKYRDPYSTYIPAVILALNNNPMRFSDRSGGVSRRRVILSFP